MERSTRSEWWFLSNINFVTVGVSYFIYLIILLIGNFIDVEVLPVVSAIIISLIFIGSNFFASKLAFCEGKLEKKSLFIYLVLNLILFLMISYKFFPMVAQYIGFSVANNILLSLVVGFVAFAINSLFVINLND